MVRERRTKIVATLGPSSDSPEKLEALGWRARTRFAEGLERAVAWYRENAWWWEPIRSGAYREYYERHYGRALRA